MLRRNVSHEDRNIVLLRLDSQSALQLFENMPFQHTFPGNEHTSDNDSIGNQWNLFSI